MFALTYIKSHLSNNALLEKTVKLSIIAIAANFIGFLIPLYIAYEYKISKKTDDFFLCYSIIIFISTIFSSAVKSVSVPFLKEKLIDKYEYRLFISSVFFCIIKYVGFLTLILIFILYLIFESSSQLIYLYLLISVPIIFFTVINSFFYGILNSLDKFYLAETTPILRAVIIFSFIFMFHDEYGMYAVIIGYNIGKIGKMIHLYYVVRIKNDIIIDLNNFNQLLIYPFLKQGVYQIFSSTIVSATPLVDRFVASFLIIGSISLLDYGDKVYMIFNVILNAFLVLILSQWSKDYLNRMFTLEKLHKAMSVVLLLSIIAFLLIIFSKDLIINIMYPNLSYNDKNMVAYILLVSMFGFIFNSISQVINRANIALRLTSIMIITASVRLVTSIILTATFASLWGLIGITFAGIIVHIIGFIVNYYFFKKRSKQIIGLR